MVFNEISVSEGNATFSIKKGVEPNICVSITQDGKTLDFVLPRRVIDSFIRVYTLYQSQGNIT